MLKKRDIKNRERRFITDKHRVILKPCIHIFTSTRNDVGVRPQGTVHQQSCDNSSTAEG